MAVVASLAVGAVAEAHTLSKGRAARVAAQVAQSAGEEEVKDPESPFVDFDARVLRCARRSAHRARCRVRIDFFERDENGELRPSTRCDVRILVLLPGRSNAADVRLRDSDIACS